MRDRGTIEILVVGDDADRGGSLAKQLSRETGFSVFPVADGVEALNYLEKYVPDLLVSATVLERMDGFGLCREVRGNARLSHLPVLLVGDLSGPETLIEALGSGADGFLPWPVADGALAARIERTLSNQRIRTQATPGTDVEVSFMGRTFSVNADRVQIIDLLLATYESALRQKDELERTRRDLSEANETIQTLAGILPICANCKKIRDDEGKWHAIETYVARRSSAQFSHGLCKECVQTLYPDLDD